MLFKFDHKSEPMASPAVFAGRLLFNLIAALILLGLALGGGMYGYHVTEGLDWLEAFLNASMLLGGMGPVDPIHTDAGKLFAGSYALVCGIVLVLATGVILAPVLHRVLHAMHVEDDGR